MRLTILNNILVMLLAFVTVCCNVRSSEHGVSDVRKARPASHEDSVCQRIKDFYMAYKRQDGLNYTEYFSPERLELLKKYCTKRLYDIQVHEMEYSDGYDIVTDNVRRSVFDEADIEVRKDSDFYQVKFNVRDGIPLINIYMKGDSIDRVINPNRFKFEIQPCDVMTYSKVKQPILTSQLVGTNWKEMESKDNDYWEFGRKVMTKHWHDWWGDERTTQFEYYIDSICPYFFDDKKVGEVRKGAYLVFYDREDDRLFVRRIVRFDRKKGEMMLYSYPQKDVIGGCGTLARETYDYYKRIR